MKSEESKDKENSSSQLTRQLAEALRVAKIKVSKYDPAKQRPIFTGSAPMNIEKFCTTLGTKLGSEQYSFPELFKALHDSSSAEEVIEQYAAEQGIMAARSGIDVPSDMMGLTLNFDMTAKGRDPKFFLTDENEYPSRISGEAYLLTHDLTAAEAVAQARSVIPDYMPHEPPGISERVRNKRKETVFNSYLPPSWVGYAGWDKLPNKLPHLFKKLIGHLFVIAEEREYFLDWLHDSLFHRAYVYKILCGAPGTGKNRLKLILTALHGHDNSIDGKKSTLTERFNSQLSESTLAWFDELQYDAEMENTMKELQNDTISIERKGVDATRGTKLHASLVISNNKPRDNYIAFDARKFAPLQLNDKRLECSMTSEEIGSLTKMVKDPLSPDFDVAFVAQIAKYLKNRGSSGKWPNLEYRGPMFYTLAHTSMTQWQKRAVTVLIDPNTSAGWDDEKKAYLWSELQKNILRRGEFRHLKFPDYSTTKVFLEIFRDCNGKKAFTTKAVPGANILGDFYVKLAFAKIELATEASLPKRKPLSKEKHKKYDL